ncbi:MAG: sulfate permease [Pseudomonadota bacterium]|nr:sulfate permease [Pseudomonadota bacterium]
MRLGLRVRRGLRDWRSYVPLIATLNSYQRQDLSHDIMAGLIVGMVTIPQAVAYALLAGVPPQSGLYACLLPMVLYAVFGSSKQLVVGPVAVAALLVTATVSELAPRYSEAYLGITTLLCLQVGLILCVLRLTKMGGLVTLLSHPVINGFVNAAAILIIISQLPGLTGIHIEDPTNPATALLGVAAQLDKANVTALAFGLVALVFLSVSRPLIAWLLHKARVAKANTHPLTRIGPMLCAVVAATLVATFGLQDNLTTVGIIPAGLPQMTLPPLSLTLWLELLPAALIIAVVSYVESYSIGTTLAARTEDRINANQELIALGLANLGAGVTGAYPVAGSFSRSSVNFAAGGRTPVSSLVCALVIILTLLFFANLFVTLPNAVLAAIVMTSVLGLIDFSKIRSNWRIYRDDSLTELATLLLVLVVGVELGLLAGVALSVALFIRNSSQPNITQVGRLGESEQFRSVKRYPVNLYEQILALRIDENIFFANAVQIEEKLLRRVLGRHGTKHLLLVCNAVNHIDATGLSMLLRVNQQLQSSGVQLHFSDIKGPLMQQLDQTELARGISGEIFFNADQAFKSLTGDSTAAHANP